MGLLRILVFGRPNGLRARLLGRTNSSPESLSSTSHEGSGSADMVVGERSLSLGLEAPKDVTPPEGYEVILHKDALEPGQVIEIIIAGRAIAVANVDGSFHALSNSCPHAQGPLGEGTLTGPVVSCPYHGWEFDVRTGSCLTEPSATVETYGVEVVEHAVCVAI